MKAEYNYCEKCDKKVYMCAFSEGKCDICKKDFTCTHTPPNKICDFCSSKKKVCKSCGKKLEK